MTVPGLQRGALIIFFCLEKLWGALIGAGALKGANTVSFLKPGFDHLAFYPPGIETS